MLIGGHQHRRKWSASMMIASWDPLPYHTHQLCRCGLQYAPDHTLNSDYAITITAAVWSFHHPQSSYIWQYTMSISEKTLCHIAIFKTCPSSLIHSDSYTHNRCRDTHNTVAIQSSEGPPVSDLQFLASQWLQAGKKWHSMLALTEWYVPLQLLYIYGLISNVFSVQILAVSFGVIPWEVPSWESPYWYWS